MAATFQGKKAAAGVSLSRAAPQRAPALLFSAATIGMSRNPLSKSSITGWLSTPATLARAEGGARPGKPRKRLLGFCLPRGDKAHCDHFELSALREPSLAAGAPVACAEVITLAAPYILESVGPLPEIDETYSDASRGTLVRRGTRSPLPAGRAKRSIPVNHAMGAPPKRFEPSLTERFHVAVDATHDAAKKAALAIKTRYPLLQVTAYDAREKQHTRMEQPKAGNPTRRTGTTIPLSRAVAGAKR